MTNLLPPQGLPPNRHFRIQVRIPSGLLTLKAEGPKQLQPAQEEQKRAAGPKDYPGEFSFSLTNVSSKYSKAV